MKIEFIPNVRTSLEIQWGGCWYAYKAPTQTAISATANANGYTLLKAYARAFGWDYDLIEAAANDCNEKGQVAILAHVQPTLLLVPKTKANKSVFEITKDLIEAVNALGLKELHFTHYGFVQNKLPKNEVAEILTFLLNPKLATTLETVYWDIDTRVAKELKLLYANMRYKLVSNESLN